jgi:class 3 adenylate cyclase/tetratricopeptide (TPR) repeat protein
MNHAIKTVLFTDMEGSTEFTSARGDDVGMSLLRVHERIIRTAAAPHDGAIVKSTGDGYLVVFPSCAGGVATALAFFGALAEHNTEHPDTPLHVRMGLNVGPVIEESGDVYGLTVNAAARIAAKARSGQVLVSEEVVARTPGTDEWAFVDRGLFWLKGLREQWRLYQATTGAATETTGAPEGRTPFVDREHERATLRALVDRANEGNGGLVVVAGTSGVGKTRLVEEVGAEADARGLQFLVARCDEISQVNPYVPVVTVLEAAQDRESTERFREVIGEHAGGLARLLPNLRRRYPDIPPPAEIPAHEERRYLFLTVQEVLARLSAVHPMIVLLDDLHWADTPSLLFLEQLATSLPQLPILFIGTYTPEDAPPASALHTLLTKLHRRKLVHSIPLGDLGEADVEQLLRALSERAPPPAVVRTLFEATKGNAFFLEEVVRQLSEQGRLATPEWDAVTTRELEIPDSVRFSIESRLAKLEPETLRVLTNVSLLGRDFGFDLLESLGETSEDALVDAMDEAERARLVTSVMGGDGVRFTFSHDLIRRTLAQRVSLTRAQRLHVRIADALEAVYAKTLDEHAAAIAYHLDQAGRWADSERTVGYFVMAGERALEAAAYAEALGYLEHAERLLPAEDLDARARVLEGMGTAERSLGHLERALDLWRAALDVLAAAGDWASEARLCLDAASEVAWWRRGRETTELVDRGLAAIGDRPSAQRAGLLALAGRVASQAGFYERGNEYLEEALRVARAHDDERVLGLALYSQTAHHFAYHEHPFALDAGLESIEHLRRTGDVWNLANVLGYVGASLGWLGRFDEAAEIGKEGEELAQRLGNWSAYVFAEQSQTFRDVGNDPDPAVLERRGRHALALGDDFGFPWLSSIGHARIGLAEFWRGEWATALTDFEDAAGAEVRGAAGGHAARLFLMHTYLGDREIALDLVERARADFPVLGRPNSGMSWGLAATAVEAFTVLGEDAQAAALYPTTIELAATGSLMRSWDYRLLATLLGMSATCAQEWDAAEAHFRDAIRLARELPMRLEEPDAYRFYARMLLARGGPGDRESAVVLVEDAQAQYRALAMPRHVELVGELLD